MENMFWTNVVGFKLHKRVFSVTFYQRNNAACWQVHSPTLMKGVHQVIDQLVLNRKLLRRKTVLNGSYVTLMCSLVDMLRKLRQVQTLPYTVWPQKIIVTCTWSPKWLLTLNTYSHSVTITQITCRLWLRISIGILKCHWRQWR